MENVEDMRDKIEQKKVLILSLTEKDDYALAEWRKNGVDTDITLKDCPKLLRLFRRIWIKLHFPLEHIWYGEWKRVFKKYDCILVHGTWMAERVPHWIRKKAGKDIKIIWWYWNKVTQADHPERVLEQDCEKWSFDQEDCKKYGMHYNTQYYFESFQLPDRKVINDIYFLGTDGGRKEKIGSLYEQFQKMQLKTDMHIVTDSIDPSDSYYALLQKDKVSYEENLERIAQSKAVLEVLREGQTGQTLRALECLFYRKKLITNDKRVEQYEYYNKDNIFIIGKDDFDTLPAFLERPFSDIEEKTVEKYDCKAWLERFW